ncbi:MAG: pentapeptide repeat-containing protein [Gaiellaceae bacterium]
MPSKPPNAPYPPDLDEEAPEVVELEDLVDAVVADRDWSNERALRLSLQRVELRRCRLTGADFAEATMRDVVFADCRLDLAALRFARLERVVFRDCRMGECDLQGAALKDVLFERCELREATLSAAKIERLELRGCDLAGLRGADLLRSARMPWSDVLENAPLFATALGIEIVD